MRVIWEIDVDDQDPRQAAIEAQQIMRDPESIATVFTVIDDRGASITVDLLNDSES